MSADLARSLAQQLGNVADWLERGDGGMLMMAAKVRSAAEALERVEDAAGWELQKMSSRIIALKAEVDTLSKQLAEADAVIVGHWQSAAHSYPGYRIEDQATPIREAHERHASRAGRKA